MTSSSSSTSTEENPAFETALSRLEQILEQMNSSSINLDESLNLYEEADKLISFCTKRLNDAEHKIETLIKTRQGELSLGENSKPITEEFSS